MKKVSILGIEIKNYKASLILRDIKRRIYQQSNGQLKTLFIVTLNPEIILIAKSDKEFFEIIQKADWKLIDGIGIKIVGFLKGIKIPPRITGADLAEKVIFWSRERNLKIGFVLLEEGFSKKEELELFLKEKNLKNFEIISKNLKELQKSNFELRFQNFDIEILLVGLGAPYQEKVIFYNKNLYPKIRLAMGIGGTFDFWTKKKKRSPLFLRKIGLEWLWRLIIQPSRLRRTVKAVFIFFWKNF